MAASYTAYLMRSCADLAPRELLAGTREADLHTIAEDDVSDDAVILDALKQLRIENVKPPGFVFYRLSYRPEGLRQIDVERWPTLEATQGAIAELVETLEAARHPLLPRLRPHLEACVDIVDARFGSSRGEAMAPILASEVARWLAEKYNGIIRAADDTWWKLGRYREYERFA